MQLTLNGKPYEHEGDASMQSLLDEIGTDGGRVAVMINGRVISRSDRDSVRLREADTVEVLTFAGGG